MSRRLPLPLRQLRLGFGIRHVGNLSGCEADVRMQMQGNVQENPGLLSIMYDYEA